MAIIISPLQESKATILGAVDVDIERVPRFRDLAVRRVDGGTLEVLVYCAIPSFQGDAAALVNAGLVSDDDSFAMDLERLPNFLRRETSESLAGQTVFAFGVASQERFDLITRLLVGGREAMETQVTAPGYAAPAPAPTTLPDGSALPPGEFVL